MEKQIKKARILLQNPSKISKRNKFLKTSGKSETEINEELIKKTKMLLGIKGYYTNLYKLKNKTIIKHYHNLWHVEKSFRMAKSDLKMRPIYHHKVEAVKTHILICFMALAVGKFMELKTKLSLARIIKLLKSITEARILDKVTNEEIIFQSKISNEIKNMLNNIGVSY
jgi:transposase